MSEASLLDTAAFGQIKEVFVGSARLVSVEGAMSDTVGQLVLLAGGVRLDTFERLAFR
jgi:hypothetical protein